MIDFTSYNYPKLLSAFIGISCSEQLFRSRAACTAARHKQLITPTQSAIKVVAGQPGSEGETGETG